MMSKTMLMFLEKLKDIHFGGKGQANPQIHKDKRILGSTWKSLPNVRDFRIKVNDKNSLYQYFGLDKRNEPTITFKTYSNGKYNGYAYRQLKRLNQFRSNPVKFFRIAYFLCCKSKTFRVLSINSVLKNWYKTLPLHLIIKWSSLVDDIFKSKDDNLKLKRVYIDKTDKKKRPLGVPSPEWRIVLHLINGFITFYLKDREDPSQHGFTPYKGTLTAWTEIINKVVKHRFVYEYDLQNYFGELNLAYISDYLIKEGVPKEIVYYIENLNRNIPENLGEDEKNFKRTKKDMEDIKNGIFDFDSPMYDEVKVLINDMGWDAFEELMKDTCDTDNIFEFVQMQWALLDEHSPQKTQTQYKGVAQGSNLSPRLSLIPLINFNSHVSSVKYADDGLLFSNKEFDIYDNQDIGAIIHPSKSRWVIYNGKWLRPLKFLGLSYDGKTLRASTRKGSRLVANDKKEAFGIISFLESHQRDSALNSSHFTWEKLTSSHLWGYIQSRLYNGSWNMEKLEQDFLYKIWKLPPSSWSYIYHRRRLTFWNASSYASQSLIKILRNRERSKKIVRKYPKVITK